MTRKTDKNGLPIVRETLRQKFGPAGIYRYASALYLTVALLLLMTPAYGKTDMADSVNRLLVSMKGSGPDMITTGEPEEQPRVGLSGEGYLVHLGAPPSKYFPVASAVPGDPTATGRNFLIENRGLLGPENGLVDYRPSARKSRAGRHTETYVQTYSGIPVFGATVNMQVNDSAGVEYFLSRLSFSSWEKDGMPLSATPLIAPEKALMIAGREYAAEYPNVRFETTMPVLNIFDQVLIGDKGPLRLVWIFELYDSKKMVVHDKVLIDAGSGEVAKKITMRPTALEREIFDNNNSRTQPSDPVRSDITNPPGPNATGIAQVDNMYTFLGDSYNFYKTNHNRDGRDGSGGTLTAYVRWCSTDTSKDCPYSNANGGDPMVFGDGYVVDDVVAHEYTHYITSIESQLIYSNNSGAINESFSDIWGEFVDLSNGRGTDTAAVRWLAGEDMADGALRNMKNPPAFTHTWGSVTFADPDRMSGYLSNADLTVEKWDGSHGWYGDGDGVCDAGETCIVLDSGGVHINSGIGNKLAYLLTDGDKFNGYTVTGMGISAVADLFYEVQVNTLFNTPAADYYSLHWALRQAAVNLGWSTASKNNLYRACKAVEIVGFYWPIYISTAGSDVSGDGSSSNPFRTVWHGNSMASPGDALNIAPGTYAEPQTFDKIMTIKRWGSSGSVVIR